MRVYTYGDSKKERITFSVKADRIVPKTIDNILMSLKVLMPKTNISKAEIIEDIFAFIMKSDEIAYQINEDKYTYREIVNVYGNEKRKLNDFLEMKKLEFEEYLEENGEEVTRKLDETKEAKILDITESGTEYEMELCESWEDWAEYELDPVTFDELEDEMREEVWSEMEWSTEYENFSKEEIEAIVEDKTIERTEKERRRLLDDWYAKKVEQISRELDEDGEFKSFVFDFIGYDGTLEEMEFIQPYWQYGFLKATLEFIRKSTESTIESSDAKSNS